jgi:heme A synthase
MKHRFAVYAWSVLALNLLVVLWGAYVRATGSGAGCGRHWPLCNGEVLPRAARVETLIEFTHRASSGFALAAVVVLAAWAMRAYPKGHRVRRGALTVLGFMVLEALLGAGLVLFRLVADNDSLVRAFSMIAHLINTFLLIGSLTLTAWWASGGAPVSPRRHGTTTVLLAFGLAGMLILGASGAIAALGDTLFPARSLAEGLRADASPTAHLFLRLRVFHPLIALVEALYLLTTAWLVHRLRPSRATRTLGRLLVLGVLLQLVVGVTNLALLAPIGIQLLHLLLADLVWITLVLLSPAALAAPTRAAGARSRPEPALAPTHRPAGRP